MQMLKKGCVGTRCLFTQDDSALHVCCLGMIFFFFLPRIITATAPFYSEHPNLDNKVCLS